MTGFVGERGPNCTKSSETKISLCPYDFISGGGGEMLMVGIAIFLTGVGVGSVESTSSRRSLYVSPSIIWAEAFGAGSISGRKSIVRNMKERRNIMG